MLSNLAYMETANASRWGPSSKFFVSVMHIAVRPGTSSARIFERLKATELKNKPQCDKLVKHYTHRPDINFTAIWCQGLSARSDEAARKLGIQKI